MKTYQVLRAAAAIGLLSVAVSLTARQAHAQDVFQAAGPTGASIQGSIDQFRAALGATDNKNNAGPLASGRREINWDGKDVLTAGPLFDGFLLTRGALFTTPDGAAFVQATPAGLAAQFNNPSYERIFVPFSQPRLFSVVRGKTTDVTFFVPGGGNRAATVTGFGAIFSDVDLPNGASAVLSHLPSTQIDYFGAHGELLYSTSVAASPGDGRFSFFGIVFRDARIAKVRIRSGNVAPGPDDSAFRDVVMMDDFFYGEPQAR